MYLEQFFINGPGCASYLVGCEGAGIAAVVDPDRDVQKYLDAANAHGMTITHIIETHLHADHVSGNTDLAQRTGADISVVYSLARVAYDQVVGYLADSLPAWEALGLPTTSGDVRDIEPMELRDLLENGNGDRPVVIDVRESWEYSSGHVPGARLISLGEFAQHVDDLDPAQPVALICASGSRSQSAAALLGQKGFETVYNVVGGTYNWMQHGLPLEKN